MKKTTTLLSAALVILATVVQSAPVFRKEHNPRVDVVPQQPSSSQDDRGLPKGVPIPVKFHPGQEPEYLLTQVLADEDGNPKDKIKDPELPRGKGKPGEKTWKTAYRELYEESELNMVQGCSAALEDHADNMYCSPLQLESHAYWKGG
jgi:hypothetical protein